MLADELARTQARATAQAEQRNARHEARSHSKEIQRPTSSDITTSGFGSTTAMEDYQYRNIIDSIPTFSGEAHENIHDWLEIVSLKFEILGYNHLQKRRFIPQYLTGNALKWHLAHRDQLEDWNAYIEAITTAFPRIIITSRDMNLKMLRERKQGNNESFTEYYTSVIHLCRKHDPQMVDLQIIDWLKAGMQINLYEKLQGDDFTTPQALLSRAQRVELDNAVLDARKRENITPIPINQGPPPLNYDRPKRLDSPAPYSPRMSQTYPRPYPPSLLSLPAPTSFSPSFSPFPAARTPYSSQPSTYEYSGSYNTDASARPRRTITCYSCGEYGHISPNCPYHPKA